MTFRKQIRKKKFGKNDFHTVQDTMFHRPLTNTSSLKITAAYCTLGYNFFDFFKKTKSPDPLIDAKLNSNTHL